MSSRSIPRALPATKHASYKEVSSQYYDDDICGDRAGWTTYTVTWRVHWVEFADSFHLSYTATGRYVTDFDDPAIEDYEGQFTASTHFNLTPGGTVTATEQFHDSPGSIQIKTQLSSRRSTGPCGSIATPST